MHTRIPLVFTLGLALLCGACIDLTVVTQLAKNSQDVGSTFKSIMADGLTSCQDTNKIRGAAQEDCTALFGPAVQDPLSKVNDALFAYVASLGKLSGASGSADFTKVSADLKTAGASSDVQTKATAAGGLANAIQKILVSGYEQAKLSKIIGDQNDNVAKVVSFLHDYAADKYVLEYKNQITIIGNYCAAQRDQHTNEPLALIIFAKSCSDQTVAVRTKQDAVTKYQDALTALATAHQKLATSRTKWTVSELAKMLGPEVQQIGEAAQKLQAAF